MAKVRRSELSTPSHGLVRTGDPIQSCNVPNQLICGPRRRNTDSGISIGKKAFMRLQYEIAKISDDESLFAWNDSALEWSGMFAQSPSAFANSGDVFAVYFTPFYRKPWSVTNRGLAIDLNVKSVYTVNGVLNYTFPFLELAPLNCARYTDKQNPLCIRLSRQNQDQFVRWGPGEVVFEKDSLAHQLHDEGHECRTVYVLQLCTYAALNAPPSRYHPEIQSFIISSSLSQKGFQSAGVWFSDSNTTIWDAKTTTLTLSHGFGALMFDNSHAENFLLILRALRYFPTIDILIWKREHVVGQSSKGTHRIQNLYGPPDFWVNSGAHQASGGLQDGHVLSVALRKASVPGQKQYFVDIDITKLMPSIVSHTAPKKTPLSRRLLGRV